MVGKYVSTTAKPVGAYRSSTKVFWVPQSLLKDCSGWKHCFDVQKACSKPVDGCQACFDHWKSSWSSRSVGYRQPSLSTAKLDETFSGLLSPFWLMQSLLIVDVWQDSFDYCKALLKVCDAAAKPVEALYRDIQQSSLKYSKSCWMTVEGQ